MSCMPTLDFLQRTGLILPNMCPLCKREAELADHILVLCHFVYEVWNVVLYEANVSWISSNNCSSFIQQWFPPDKHKKNVVLWRLFLPVVWWSIWLERNHRIFEDFVEPSYITLRKAKDLCFFWAANCKIFE